MATAWNKLGVVAGGGPLPGRVAAAAQGQGRAVHVVRLIGYADEHVAGFPGDDCGLGEVAKIVRVLREAGCDAVVLAGLVQRPDLSALKLDWRGVALLPKVVAAARRGDGALLSVLVETFEEEGFSVVGAENAVGALVAPAGPFGAIVPNKDHMADIEKAARLIHALGGFDVGQAAVVRNGHVLAVEAAEGTDAMLARCAGLGEAVKGGNGRPAGGVLVKRPKPGQELRVDLPTIGLRTIDGAVAAGLAGVAVEAGRALVMDRKEATGRADAAGLFIYGFQGDEVDDP